jgi:hypothetical protein
MSGQRKRSRAGKSISLILMAIAAGAGMTALTPSTTALRSATVPVDIHIGRPPWCTGRGLCKLTPATAGPNGAEAAGILCLDQRGHLLLKIPADHCNSDLWTLPSKDGYLQIEETIPLPQQIASALRGSKSASLSPGRYRTTRTSDTLYIFF